MLKGFNINRERVIGVLRQALSPAFLLILLVSCLLWFTTKLGYEYTSQMPLKVRIDGQKYKVTALVTGRGSTILAQRLSLKSPLDLSLDDLSSRSSRQTKGALTITPASLQRAINDAVNELKVEQIVEAPEFVPAPKEVAADADGDGNDDGETAREKRKRERQERRDKRAAEEAEAKAAKEREEAEAAKAKPKADGAE
ncbi:MAG: hypothetical protein LBV18_00455 [Alistipes sp.]|jgi:hypothetical protein|nr:hypothetical protein [Alistipes sp.]